MEKVTQELVFTAADALVGEGKTPTVAAVRDWLGKGSLATITPMMREWRKQRQEEDGADAQVAALPETVQVLFVRLWAAAEKAASARLAGEKAALDAEQETLRQELAEAIQAADAATEEAARLNKVCEQVRAEKDAASAEAAELREQLAAAEAARDAFKAQAEKLDTKLDAALERAMHAEGALAALQGKKPAPKPKPTAKKGNQP